MLAVTKEDAMQHRLDVRNGWRRRLPPALPTTTLGRRAAVVVLVGTLLVVLGVVVPGATVVGFGLCLAGGAGTIVAVRRDGDLSLLALLVLLPFALVLVFLLAELLVGHD